MVMNRRDLNKGYSPTKTKRLGKRTGRSPIKPSTSGSTSKVVSDDDQTSIKVIVRIRPSNDKEQQDNYRNIIKIIDSKMLVFDPKEEENPFFYRGVQQKGRDLLKKQNKELQFIFDRVFDRTVTNNEVFYETTKDIISDLLEGYNCSVFAYGATGAGKTHTMLGKDNDPGITYRTVAELFNQINDQSEHRNFNLGVSYLEIYNENVQDLLHKIGPLALREDGRASVFVAGLKIKTITNADELLSLLAYGNKNRTQHPTDANAESSRSHAVFQVYVNITNKLDGQIKQVKLSMIDLAGSERASATGCKGARLKEGANINKSLLALGNCINKLAEGIKHIPYRDSKLTRLLKDSLGGNCRTVMIANVAPSSLTYEDTYNTLRYANRAKNIKTHIKKNIISCEMHVHNYIKIVEEQKKEITMLKQKLLALESKPIRTVTVPDHSDEIRKDVKELKDKITDLMEKKRSLNEKVLSLQSTDKILCCRIQHKLTADKRLRNLTINVDLMAEEQNASGKSRVNKSLLNFKRSREVVRAEMEAVWHELRDIEKELDALNNMMRSKGLIDKLGETMTFLQRDLDCTRAQQQYEHARKVCSIGLCELESLETISKMMSSTLQSYYNMMRGYGTMTDKMKAEFKQLVKSLEGVRNIKWADANLSSAEDSYSLTCLSIEQLINPNANDMPIHNATYDEEEEATSPTAGKKINSGNQTFVASPGDFNPTTTEIHNSTVKINDDDFASTPTRVELNGSAGVDAQQLNSTFNLIESKQKKRILGDKTTGGKTPVKQPRKISPKNNVKAGNNAGAAVGGKENKVTQRPPSVMSAKSVSILNKLKTDRIKQLPQISTANFETTNSTGNSSSHTDTFKAIRTKERRGLTTVSHPYQKVKPKVITASQSSRVPW